MRKLSSISIFVTFWTALFIFSSCCRGTDCDPAPNPPVHYSAKGIYVLNEGSWNMNNSGITYYNLETQTIIEDVFRQVNHRGLGETANDLAVYGNKMYCAVSGSGLIEVMQISDCKSIKQISCIGKTPRKLAFHNGKAYVSCHSGEILKIDTASLEIENTWTAGRNPEGICVCNNKLYVANSGGLDGAKYDNTVTVFDLSSGTNVGTISVALNPYTLETNGTFVYLVTRGNYDDILPSLQRIDNMQIKAYPDIHPFNLSIHENEAILYSYDYFSGKSWIKKMNLQTETIENQAFITDNTKISQPYSIGFHPSNGDVYVADSYTNLVNGDVFCFDKNGKKKFQFSTGMNPSKIIVIQ